MKRSIFKNELEILRNSVLREAFHRLDEPDAPWMHRTGVHDADTVMRMGRFNREPELVYCWKNPGFWTSLTATKVAGMIDGFYSSFPYEAISSVTADRPRDVIRVNGKDFWVPEIIKDRMAELINLARSHNDQ